MCGRGTMLLSEVPWQEYVPKITYANIELSDGYWLQVWHYPDGYSAYLDMNEQEPTSENPTERAWGTDERLHPLELMCLINLGLTDIEELLHGTETEAAGTP
jgi:hypothetical protein